MLFIVWAWQDSNRTSSYAVFSPYSMSSDLNFISIGRWGHAGNRGVGRDAARVREGVIVAWFPPPGFRRGAGSGWRPSPGEMFHRYALGVMSTRRKDNWLLVIPHWLLLLIVAIPWCGLLFRRARRQRRAQDAIAIPEASP
jgi:hypothetical protein